MHQRRAQSIVCRLGVGLLCLTRAVSAVASDGITLEYRIKAAFLFNFTRFIGWPAESFADPASPIVIGVTGEDPFGAELANVLKGRRVNGRPIVVRSITNSDDARTAHLLFIGTTEPEELAQLMRSLHGLPVMTVGESAVFAGEGGMIRFVLRGDKVRFEINAGAAEQARLRVSAQLEKLATVVHGTTQPKEGSCARCVTSRFGGN
jgi:hypothetical protein